LNKKALEIRAYYTSIAIDSSCELLNSVPFIKDSIKDTLFEKYIQTSDLDLEAQSMFALNANVTRTITRELIPQIQTLEDYFFVSKVVEQGYFKLLYNLENKKLKNNLSISKEFGAFYTPLRIAREMAKDAVLSSKSKIIIDPCLGTGNLLAACLEYAAENNINLTKLIGIEIDPLATSIAQQLLERFAEALELKVDIEVINTNSLDLLSQQRELFSSVLPNGTIIINPPYGKLKFESDKLSNAETKLSFNDKHSNKKKINTIELKSCVLKALGNLSTGRGGLEWSKVFLALCFNHISEDEALVYIGPCGWLNSVSQYDFRKAIIKSKHLSKVHFISEASTGFETVNQPLAIVNINKNYNKVIELTNDFQVEPPLIYDELEKLEHFGFPIPRVHLDDIYLFVKLQAFSKVRSSHNIKNLRGELDQSIDKPIFSKVKSGLRIIRGENIGRYKELPVPIERDFYADIVEFEKRLSQKPKGIAYKQERIVCRQCSYMKQKRRLIFTLIPKNCLVGNSCNYMTVPDDSKLFYLGLFNSALMDWYFRVLNGNNHVANYEIDDFPIPEITDSLKKQLEKEVKTIISTYRSSNNPRGTTYNIQEANLDAMILTAFQLSKKEALIILNNKHSKDYIDAVLENLNNE
jgi:Alw26I/Eco31I/Esp3I family type II restriction m6 adenine DNA methyltransferase